MGTMRTSKGSSVRNAIKITTLAALVAAVAIATSIGTQPTKPAQATVTDVIALNTGSCIPLAVAFGGLTAFSAVAACGLITTQPGIQGLDRCLAKLPNGPGALDCSDTGQPIVRPAPADFAKIDLDKNQVHFGQASSLITFVDDQFPVLYKTDIGHFEDVARNNLGREFNCTAAYDPDCDPNSTLPGDGVVTVNFVPDANDKPEGHSGHAHIDVIEKNISFPVDLTITGTPDKITLSPLFGKDTISTGATPATPKFGANIGSSNPNPCDPQVQKCLVSDGVPRPTDCNFEASADGVLGANGSAEKAVIVAKVLDEDGTELAGELIAWDHPIVATTQLLDIDLPTPSGGVALPETPTLDTGPLGIGFPQFVCGFDTPGDIVEKVRLDAVADSSVASAPESDLRASVTIHVIAPAATIALAADPPSIDCNGTNTSKVTATVLNEDGQPVANGLDINFSTVALGTVNPFKADSAAGAGSTTLTPLAGANNITADGGPAGVIVTVSVNGKQRSNVLTPTRGLIGGRTIAAQTFTDAAFSTTPVILQNSILVACSGGPPPPAVQNANAAAAAGAAAAANGPRTGTISGPDTGSGGAAGSGGASGALVIELLVGTITLVGASALLKRRID